MPLPDATTVGPVHLTISDREASRRFYEDVIGLREQASDDGTLVLGAEGGVPLLVLTEEPGAQPMGRAAGLFHFAILLPERTDLARWLVHGAQARAPFTGMSEHLVSEALYLRDPDGHGIEIYRDRPRDEWYDAEGKLALTTLPLDVDNLVSSLGADDPQPFVQMPPRTRMGHVHLCVADVAATEAFYSGVLGFEEMARLGDQATFLGAGGYHHHLGGNVWNSRGAAVAGPGTARLQRFTVELPDVASRDEAAARVADAGGSPVSRDDGVAVVDPSGIELVLVA